ncbi:ABC transporter permease [Hoyosella rhizosphaerae]|uniref:ABC transporter permease n=1 Tax=Hoyosella rhizosphaerae TaxID=1755582 RepID=A0A916U5W8_9ACTN|nr:ABC transporter permease [Hoyosella rhizosphaerae]MBN4927765.1 ABC transporter permease [Hoyosella rhizosphaerae]GGC61708.1 ABC transporter permease [Hoyosella rhizosphaerae]
MGVLAAERIKLTSVKSPWWCSAIVIVAGLGLAWVTAHFSSNFDTEEFGGGGLTAEAVLGGVQLFGIMVLMVLAALIVTSEYRFGVIRNTFMAANNRSKVLVAKAGIAAIWSGVLVLVVSVVAVLIGRFVAGPVEGEALVLTNSDTLWSIGSLVVYAVLASILAVAIGSLVRQTAGAVTIVLLWPLLVENVLTALPRVGDHIMPFLPFLNIQYFLTGGRGFAGEMLAETFHWNYWGGLAYFVAVTAVIFGGALVLLNKRDA